MHGTPAQTNFCASQLAVTSVSSFQPEVSPESADLSKHYWGAAAKAPPATLLFWIRLHCLRVSSQCHNSPSGALPIKVRCPSEPVAATSRKTAPSCSHFFHPFTAPS